MCVMNWQVLLKKDTWRKNQRHRNHKHMSPQCDKRPCNSLHARASSSALFVACFVNIANLFIYLFFVPLGSTQNSAIASFYYPPFTNLILFLKLIKIENNVKQ